MGQWWRAYGQPHALENFTRSCRWMDCGKNLQTSVTIRTLQNIEFKNTFHQLCPQIIPPFSPRAGAVSTFANIQFTVVFGMCRNDAGSPLCGRSRYPVKSYEIHSGSRHQGGEPGYKFQRLKDDVRCSVSPGHLQSIAQLPIRQLLQAFGRDRRAA
jgi:hypothetical protein